MFLLSIITVTGCGQQKEEPKVIPDPPSVITIGHIAMTGSSPQALIGKEQKQFENAFTGAGYDGVEWVVTRGRDNVGPMMEEGIFHFLYTPINNYTAYFTETSQFAAGDNYKIIAGSLAVPEGSVLLVNETISDLNDLDGKVIGIANNSYSHEMFLNLQLEKVGLATETVGGTVRIEFQDYLITFYEMFEQGAFDAIIIRQSEEKRLLDKYPTAKALLNLNDGKVVGDLIPSVWLYARTDVLENWPDLVNLMLETHIETTAAAEANRDILPRLAEETLDYYYYEIIGAQMYEKTPMEEMIRSWSRYHITYDPNEEFAQRLHKFIFDSGYTDKSYAEFADFAPLNAILAK
jgi:NitT/TauT family transport system substrate-binding protein